MHSSDYATPSQAMAAARTIPLDLIEGFSGAEKVPDRISTKNTFKLKLYDNLLANRKAFEVYDATFRAGRTRLQCTHPTTLHRRRLQVLHST